MIQTWKFKTYIKAGWDNGAVRLTTTEVLCFHTRTLRTHTVGWHEDEKVNQHSVRAIDASVTPQDAAAYRETHGYTRVS